MKTVYLDFFGFFEIKTGNLYQSRKDGIAATYCYSTVPKVSILIIIRSMEANMASTIDDRAFLVAVFLGLVSGMDWPLW
jgi:hypothetical protein